MLDQLRSTLLPSPSGRDDCHRRRGVGGFLCAQLRRLVPGVGGGVRPRSPATSWSSPGGGDSSAEEGPRGSAVATPHAGSGGPPAGIEAICVSSACEGHEGGGGGGAGEGAGGGRFVVGA